MDPITATVIAGVLWLIIGPIPGILVFFVSQIAATQTQKFSIAVIGWVLGLGWSIFVTIQVALHIITVIQLLTS